MDLNLNKESLLVGLDLIDEFRDKSRIREEACKVRAARRYNSKVKPRSFQREIWCGGCTMTLGKMRASSRAIGNDLFVFQTQRLPEHIIYNF